MDGCVRPLNQGFCFLTRLFFFWLDTEETGVPFGFLASSFRIQECLKEKLQSRQAVNFSSCLEEANGGQTT